MFEFLINVVEFHPEFAGQFKDVFLPGKLLDLFADHVPTASLLGLKRLAHESFGSARVSGWNRDAAIYDALPIRGSCRRCFSCS